MRTYILLGISVLAGLAAFVIFSRHVDKRMQELGLAGKKVKILVPRKNLLRGEAIPDETVLARKEMFAADLTKTPDGYLEIELTADNIREVIGRRLAVSVDRGQPLRWSDFEDSVRRRKDTFANLINQEYNHRALSIAVDNVTSVSGLIRPNDHVDIIGTFRFPQLRTQADVETMTLTLLQNVTVLAVGQYYYQGRIRSTRRDRGYTTLTLSVTAKEAEMLVFAQQKGQLTFTLRHPEDVYIEDDVQDVDFKYLKDNIKKYTAERKEKMKLMRNRGN